MWYPILTIHQRHSAAELSSHWLLHPDQMITRNIGSCWTSLPSLALFKNCWGIHLVIIVFYESWICFFVLGICRLELERRECDKWSHDFLSLKSFGRRFSMIVLLVGSIKALNISQKPSPLHANSIRSINRMCWNRKFSPPIRQNTYTKWFVIFSSHSGLCNICFLHIILSHESSMWSQARFCSFSIMIKYWRKLSIDGKAWIGSYFNIFSFLWTTI